MLILGFAIGMIGIVALRALFDMLWPPKPEKVVEDAVKRERRRCQDIARRQISAPGMDGNTAALIATWIGDPGT